MSVVKYVPPQKRSKKEQRALARSHRRLWQGIKLCPRIMPSKTAYRRKGRRVEGLQL